MVDHVSSTPKPVRLHGEFDIIIPMEDARSDVATGEVETAALEVLQTAIDGVVTAAVIPGGSVTSSRSFRSELTFEDVTRNGEPESGS